MFFGAPASHDRVTGLAALRALLSRARVVACPKSQLRCVLACNSTTLGAPQVFPTWLWVKTLYGEHQNRWQMDVHPPRNGAIGYAPRQCRSLLLRTNCLCLKEAMRMGQLVTRQKKWVARLFGSWKQGTSFWRFPHFKAQVQPVTQTRGEAVIFFLSRFKRKYHP